MRAPAERPHADFASLNSTLTTFLGGKQKAWMTLDHQYTPSYTANLPPKQRHSQATRAAPPGSVSSSGPVTGYCADTGPAHQYSLQWNSRRTSMEQGPSNSTSPVLANMINQRKDPSGQPASATNGVADTVLPSPAPSDDVHPDLSNNSGDLESEQEDPEARRLIDLAARCGGIDELERRLFSTDRSESLPLDPPPSRNDPNSVVVPGGEVFSATPQETPRKPSLGHSRSQNKRARTQAPNGHPLGLAESNDGTLLRHGTLSSVTYEIQTPPTPSLKQYVPILDNYVTTVGCTPGLEGSIELPRIRLLKDACNTEDCFYLALHQLYCLSSVEPQLLMQLPGFTREHLSAFNTLAQLLLPNTMLPDYATKWFSTFPAPIQNLLLYSSLYQKAYNNVTNFLLNLLRYWLVIQARCKQRMYPPLVDELVYELRLESGVFQHVAFTAVLRGIWGPDQNHRYQRAEELFRQDQGSNVRRRDRINSAEPPTAAEMQAANEKLARDYQLLRIQHLREVQDRSSNPQTIQMPVNERLTARVPNHRASVPSSHEPGFVLPVVATNDSQVRPEVRRTQSVAGVPAFNSQPSQYNLVLANDRVHLTQPPRGVRMPVAFAPATNYRQRIAQSQRQQAGPLRSDQQPARLNSNRPPPISTIEHRIPLSGPRSSRPQCSFFPPGLETLPPGASGAHGPVHHQDLAMPGRQSSYTSCGVSRTAPLGEQQLIPSANQVPTFSSRPDPTSSAMHQAHLRSPTLKPVDRRGTGAISTNLYQYVAKLALPPQPIIAGSRNHVWSFHVSEVEFETVPSDTPSPYGAPPTREVHQGSQIYRIRCAKLPYLEGHTNEMDWAVTESVWPSYLFIEINGVRLGLRRKQHHGKDLPIDITPHVKKGVNEVSVCLIGPSKQKDGAQYALAVETIHVVDHKQALVAAVPVPANEILDPIKASLTSKPGDDDLRVVDNTITINLIDPFSARIFNVPVRGLACRHRECFDHENYLQTRQAGWRSMVDEWRCPICRADARPQNLVMDCFLAEVREELAQQKRLDTKAIIIEEDGTWRPRAQIRNEMQGGESRLEATQASSAAATPSGGVLVIPQRESVVIELDDD